MPTVIDELIVVLGLDATKFTQEQRKVIESWRKTREAAVAGGKDVEKGMDGVAEAVANTTKRFLALGALFAGGLGMKKFVDDVKALSAELTNLGRNAQTAGASVQSFYKFGAAAKAYGLDPAEIQNSMVSLRQRLAQVRILGVGTDPMLVQFLGKMGIQANELSAPNGVESVMRRMNQYGDRLRKQGMQQPDIEGFFRAGGMSAGTSQFLGLEPEKFTRLLEEFKKYAPSDKDVTNAQELNEAFAKASAAWEKLGRDIALGLAGPFKGFLEWIEKLANFLDRFKTRTPAEILQEQNQRYGPDAPSGYDWLKQQLMPGSTAPTQGGSAGKQSSIWDNTVGSVVGSAAASPSPAGASPSGGGPSGLSGVAAGGQINIPQGAAGSGGGSSGGGAIPSDILAKARQVAIQGGPGAVSQFMAAQGYPKSGNWCGEFAAAVVKSVGGTPPKNPEVASNWRNYAPQVYTPMPGDMAVRKGVQTGSTGSHVTIVESVEGNRFTGLGGNQGRFESKFPTSRYDFFRSSPREDAWGKNAQPVPFSDWLTNPQTRNLMKTSGITTTNNRTSSETNVGNINVNTQATDAYGIARDLKPLLSNNDQTQSFNYGPN